MEGRVPYDQSLFASYLRTTDDNLKITVVPTTATVFGWLDPEVMWWHKQRVLFLDDVDGLWTIHENPLLRTKDVNAQVKKFIAGFHAVANPMLDRAAASPASTTSLATLYNFVIGRKAPTHPTTPIESLLYGIYTQLGGGQIKGKMHSDEEAHRPKINREENADGVEVAYTLGETEMTDPEAAGTNHIQFSKAIFIINMGVGNSGSAVWINQRSINTKHPELNGPWNKPQKFYLQ